MRILIVVAAAWYLHSHPLQEIIRDYQRPLADATSQLRQVAINSIEENMHSLRDGIANDLRQAAPTVR